MTNLIQLQKDFMFGNIFNQKRNVSKLELFISKCFGIPYKKVHNNLELIPRKLPKNKKIEAAKEVDLVLKLENELIKFNFEVNYRLSKNKIDRNIIYLCSISSSNYQEGDKNYSNIWSSAQLNFNVHGKKNDKFISEYILKERETNEILSEKLQIYMINMEIIDNLCYNKLDEKEKIVYCFCKILLATTIKDLYIGVDY